MSIFDVFMKIHDAKTSKWGQHGVVFSENHDEKDYQVNHPISLPWFLGANSKVIHVFIQRQFWNLVTKPQAFMAKNAIFVILTYRHYRTTL